MSYFWLIIVVDGITLLLILLLHSFGYHFTISISFLE